MLGTPPGSPLSLTADPSYLSNSKEFNVAGQQTQEFNIADEEDCDLSTAEAITPRDEHIATELAVRAGTARETRKAFVGAAEAYVQMKALALNADVAIQRCAQEHETERCRITEAARARQVQRLADVAETLVVERHRTQRERDALRAKALSEAIAVHAKIETRRIETQTGMASIFQWVLASFMGAVGASVVNQPSSKPRNLRRRTGARQYFSALILIAFVRHLWLNVSTRHLLVWADGFGPFLRGFLSKMLKNALRTILESVSSEGEALAEDEVHPQNAGAQPFLPISVAEEMRRFAAGKPVHAPDAAPDSWISHHGPDGRIFWHHTALGAAPWDQCVTDTPALNSSTDTAEASAKESNTSRFRALLANWGLNQYTGALEQNGYNAEAMKTLNHSGVEKMLQVISCRPEHVETFGKALESWRS